VPLRFFRRIRIAPGVSVNVSKSGASVSVGPRGAKVTVGRKGIRKTVGLPGTGVYYTTTSPLPHRDPAPDATTTGTAGTGVRGFWARRSFGGKAVIVIVVLVVIAVLMQSNAGPGAPAVVAAIPTGFVTD
jgi:Protein of unknown function (DUF4236)